MLSVGKLMLLRIGNLWQDQKPFAQPAYAQESGIIPEPFTMGEWPY